MKIEDLKAEETHDKNYGLAGGYYSSPPKDHSYKPPVYEPQKKEYYEHEKKEYYTAPPAYHTEYKVMY